MVETWANLEGSTQQSIFWSNAFGHTMREVIIIPILQTSKLRLRELHKLAQNHAAPGTR